MGHQIPENSSILAGTLGGTIHLFQVSAQSVRTLIHTTNAIENFNRQLCKVTKSKVVFPNTDRLLKMLIAQMDITRKWTGRRRDWGEIHSQLEIFFADRLPQ